MKRKDLRWPPDVLALIERALKRLNAKSFVKVTFSAFVRRAAIEKANKVLSDA